MYCLLFRLIEYQFHNRLQPVIYSHPNTRVFVLALVERWHDVRCASCDRDKMDIGYRHVGLSHSRFKVTKFTKPASTVCKSDSQFSYNDCRTLYNTHVDKLFSTSKVTRYVDMLSTPRENEL